MKNKTLDIKTTHEGRNYHRHLYVNGENVAHVAVVDFTTRIGSSEVRLAGIGDVRTVEEHRNKGYMRLLMDDTIVYMKEQGYPLSMLIGTPDFYHKFGYSVCLSIPHLIVETDALTPYDDVPSMSVRPLQDDDYPQVIALYNKNNKDRTGSLVRESRYFKSFFRGSVLFSQTENFVLEDENGSVLGYVVYDKHKTELNVVEVEVEDSRYYPKVINELIQLAERKNCAKETSGKKEKENNVISLFMPGDHPFIQFSKRFGGDIHDHYPKNGMGMMRINQLSELFTAIIEELSLRSRSVCFPDEDKRICIITDIGSLTLNVKYGCVSITNNSDGALRLELSQDKLIQLLTGYRTVEDLLIDPTEQVVCEDSTLASLLYSSSPAYIWSTDLF